MTAPATSEVVSRWWFVSDLHLDPHGDDAERVGAAFSTLVSHVVLADACPRRHVVLLGDTFELRGGSRVTGDRVADRLKALAASAPSFFAGVAKCLDEGVNVHVMCGNHDVRLLTRDLTETLAQLVCGMDSRRRKFLTVHPWILHVPGLFYAEHGHQHHALNRMPTLLQGAHQESSSFVPRTALDAWTNEPGRRAFRRALAVLNAVRSTRKDERDSRSAGYVTLLRQVGEGASLEPELMQAIHSVSHFGIPTTMVRTAGRVLGRRFGTSKHDGYLRAAAVRIDRILAPFGGPVCYVFGHTHQARLERLSSSGAWYVNAGTWSVQTRGSTADEPGRFPYVVVSAKATGPGVELRYWRPSSRQHGPTAGAGPRWTA
jgi:hypothetical protein